MNGIDASTGKSLSGKDHLRQSIRDILMTRRGTRVMRRDYGSNLPNLVDAPMNAETLSDIIAESAIAIAMWETRIDLTQVTVDEAQPGRVVISLYGTYTPTGEAITVDGIEVT